jgi:hypothetical protein
MGVVYNAALKTSRMTAVVTAIDASGAADHATIQIGTGPASPWAIGTVLAELELNYPSFTVAGDTINMSVTPPISDDATALGTAATAQILNGVGVPVVTGLLVGATGASGVEVTLNSTSISPGQTVTLNSGTITHG